MPPAKTERNAEIVKAWARGRSQGSLAEEHGISQQAISDIIKRHRVAQGPIDKAEEISRAADLLDDLIAECARLVGMEGAPVTAGKDGTLVVDPEVKSENGGPVFVRDYSGRLAAIDRIRALMERKSKLLGLDSATKTEVSGTVNYVLPGVDPETLR